MNVTALQNQIATYLGRDSVADFMLNGQDISLYALNSARRKAEQAHDFKFSELNVSVSVPSNGLSFSSIVISVFPSVAGTLTPNAAGSYPPEGIFGSLPLYINAGATSYFNYYNVSIGKWILSGQLTTGNSPSPVWTSNTSGTAGQFGFYSAGSGASGTASVLPVSAGQATIKRIKSVSLPLNSGEYEPIEFLTDDEYIARTRKQIGRQPYNPSKSLANLGVSYLGNPIAYQLGQTLYFAPATLPFPVAPQLFVVQFLPDYTTGSNTDFFTTYGPEYMYWQGIIECNNYYKRFTDQRVEGQVDDEKVQALADKALANFIEWDRSTVRSTSTPNAQGVAAPAPAPPAPQPQAA